MKRHLAYLKYVVRHKYFVFLECLKIGVPIWMALLHDWDKFLPGEWFPYAETFYMPNGEKRYQETSDFARAWNAHQKRNKHHWQYWMLTWDRGETICLEMPYVYLLEMVADWKGVGRSFGQPDVRVWYEKNRWKIQLHPNTRSELEKIIGYGPKKNHHHPPLHFQRRLTFR